MVCVRSVNVLACFREFRSLEDYICLLIHGFIKGLCVEIYIMVCGYVCWHRCMLCAVLGDCVGVHLCFGKDVHIRQYGSVHVCLCMCKLLDGFLLGR